MLHLTYRQTTSTSFVNGGFLPGEARPAGSPLGPPLSICCGTELLGLVEWWFLQARCPSCHPTISVKALKETLTLTTGQASILSLSITRQLMERVSISLTQLSNVHTKLIHVLQKVKLWRNICNTWLDSSKHIWEVKARRQQVFKHVNEIDGRNFGDGVTSVHCTHDVHATVLVDSNQYTTYTGRQKQRSINTVNQKKTWQFIFDYNFG